MKKYELQTPAPASLSGPFPILLHARPGDHILQTGKKLRSPSATIVQTCHSYLTHKIILKSQKKLDKETHMSKWNTNPTLLTYIDGFF